LSFILIVLLIDAQFLGKATMRFHVDPELLHISQRLIVDLGRISGALPSSLLIKGVSLNGSTAVMGGGFADIYRGRHQGRDVALKRLRVWESQDRHITHCVWLHPPIHFFLLFSLLLEQMLCKEALVWAQLDHIHVLPFLGLDGETFPGALCMISPWMQHGTVFHHIRDTICLDVMQLVRKNISRLASCLS
jgi:serine/threonine-protein kinase TNNI3K